MICAWEALLAILPVRLRSEMAKVDRDSLQELRLRRGKPMQMILYGKPRWTGLPISEPELQFVIQTASRYSPWAADGMSQGYVTAPGGHRIGIAGECVIKAGQVSGFRSVTSLCIRVARDVPGIAAKIPTDRGSVLILGAPGWGKTTLLRDLVRKVSQTVPIAVIDQRGEIFPAQAAYDTGKQTDVLTMCDKAAGVDMAIRTLSPQWVAVDEITSQSDCDAILRCGWCGVSMIATAHACSKDDLFRRRVYRPLVDTGIFETLVILHGDKSWHLERIGGG